MTQHVREIMTANPVSVTPQTAINDAARLMVEKDIGDVFITEDGRLRGLVTDRDLVARALAESRPANTPVEKVCSSDPVTCSPEDDTQRAAQLMREHALRRLPVVEQGRLVGVISLGDLAIERDPRSALADISAAAPNT